MKFRMMTDADPTGAGGRCQTVDTEKDFRSIREALSKPGKVVPPPSRCPSRPRSSDCQCDLDEGHLGRHFHDFGHDGYTATWWNVDGD